MNTISLDNCYAKLKRVDETINVLVEELNYILEDSSFDVKSELQEDRKRFVFFY